jgi:radical SAM PhpK family P-methyltransferase
MSGRKLDCIVVGYNDLPFDSLVKKHQPLERHSATYSELRTNSILLGGARRNYMELLNKALERIHGHDPQLNSFEAPNLGAVYLASFLHRQGLAVEMVNLFNKERSRFAALLAEGPRCVAITTTYYVDEDPIREIIEFVRTHSPSTLIVVGGPYVHNLCAATTTLSQDSLLRSLGADIYIRDSQGESSLAQLCQSIRDSAGPEGVPNLIYRRGKSMARTARQIEKNDLNTHNIDWSQFNPGFFAPTTYMRTARSCPFSCAFCNYPAMSGEHTVTEVEVIRRELRQLAESGVKYVIFVDDTFNVPLPRFKKLCQMMIDENLGLRWISFFRCANADDACFDLMARSGCLGVYLGIESGDDRILTNMNKHAQSAKYRAGIRKLHDRGILTFGSFIAGYPGETEETILNTVQFLEDTSPTFFNVQLYYHDPIAPVNRRREEFGIVGDHYSWRHKTMSWEEGTEWVEYMLRTSSTSLPLTLYGFSIWSIPYLLSNGLSLEQIKGFAGAARKMLIKSLDDVEDDYAPEWTELAGVLSDWRPDSRRLPSPPLL